MPSSKQVLSILRPLFSLLFSDKHKMLVTYANDMEQISSRVPVLEEFIVSIGLEYDNVFSFVLR